MATSMLLHASPSIASASVAGGRRTALWPAAVGAAPCRGAGAGVSGGAAAYAASPNVARRPSVRAQVIVSSREERRDDDIQEVLFTPEQLNEILDDLGRQIGRDYADKHLLVLGVLKGGFVFTSDLIRHVNPVPLSMEVEFFKAASYGMGTHSTGSIQLDETFDLSLVKDRHVLVTEDIIDTGLTMSSIVSLLRRAGAMSVRVAVLLDKRTRRTVTFDADYVGIVCPDQFVVGYGIDFAERYRWLPYIGVPKPEIVAQIIKDRQAKEAQRAEQLAQKQAKRIAAAVAAAESPAPKSPQQEEQAAVDNGRSDSSNADDKKKFDTPFVLNPAIVVSSVVNGRPKTATVGGPAPNVPHANGTRVALLPKPQAPGRN